MAKCFIDIDRSHKAAYYSSFTSFSLL